MFALSILVTGCSSGDDGKQNSNDSNINNIISPEIKINEQYYRGVLPYKKSPINGTLSEIPNRLDSSHFELALIEYAMKIYDPAVYIFEEGQVLTNKDIDPLINAKKGTQFENFVFSITEHNYLLEDGSFAGMFIGVSVSPQYYEKDQNGEYKKDTFGVKVKGKYSEEELVEKSKLLIDELVTIIRSKTNVPLSFGIMRAETIDLKIPGTFFISANVPQSENSVSKYNLINEEYIFLPTDLAKLEDKQIEVARGFSQFKKEVGEYIPNFAGVTGLARFVDNNLLELSIEIYTEFDSTVQVIQLTQFSIAKIAKYFPGKMNINLYISTINKPKAIYVRNVGGQEFMHIYR